MLFVRKEEQVLGAFDHPRVELIPAALLAPRALQRIAVAPSECHYATRESQSPHAALLGGSAGRVDGDIRILLGNETGAPPVRASASPSFGR